MFPDILSHMNNTRDAYGQQLLAQYNSRTASIVILERDDRFIYAGSEADVYFRNFKQWSPLERRAIRLAKGRILDIGCGAGRHSLYLQHKGLDVTGIDISPGAVKVCKLRGLKKAFVRPISDVDKFKPDSFDTVLMLGNNFGLFGSAEGAKPLLKKLSRITLPDARIIAGTRNPYKTSDHDYLQYHRLNKRRGKMPGQIKMRVRFRNIIGAWFDYLFVSPEEMKEVLSHTDWQVERLVGAEDALYFAVIRKKSSPCHDSAAR